MVSARRLDRALDRFRPTVSEEYRVGKSGVDQPLGKFFALRAAIEVRDVHQCCGLILDRLGQMRMAMAKHIDRDTAGKVQSPRTIFGNKPGALASDGTKTTPGIYGHERGNRHLTFLPTIGRKQNRKGDPIGRLSNIGCSYMPLREGGQSWYNAATTMLQVTGLSDNSDHSDKDNSFSAPIAIT